MNSLANPLMNNVLHRAIDGLATALEEGDAPASWSAVRDLCEFLHDADRLRVCPVCGHAWGDRHARDCPLGD